MLLVISAAMAVTYGVTDEFHQMFVPGRSFQVLDLEVNTLGSVVAVIGICLLSKYFGSARVREAKFQD